MPLTISRHQPIRRSVTKNLKPLSTLTDN